MLRDNIYKNLYSITEEDIKGIIEKFPMSFRGEVEIIGERNGEIVHYDRNHNTVTDWMKFATMQMIAGNSFSQYGETRSEGDHSSTKNSDGTVVSGDTSYFASTAITEFQTAIGSYIYPFYATKMLFGTGKEASSWSALTSEEQTFLQAEDGYTSTANFDANISDSSNVYSYDSQSKKRTYNDSSSAILTGTISTSSHGITGAIKNGTYTDSTASGTYETTDSSNNKVLKYEYRGIGKPSFIYLNRNNTNRTKVSTSEIYLSTKNTYEDQIVFTVTLPAQPSGDFYPYNGYTLKEIGLFADAKLSSLDASPSNYMPYGIMLAKRYIAPIYKTHDLSITAKWTIYIS